MENDQGKHVTAPAETGGQGRENETVWIEEDTMREEASCEKGEAEVTAREPEEAAEAKSAEPGPEDVRPAEDVLEEGKAASSELADAGASAGNLAEKQANAGEAADGKPSAEDLTEEKTASAESADVKLSSENVMEEKPVSAGKQAKEKAPVEGSVEGPVVEGPASDSSEPTSEESASEPSEPSAKATTADASEPSEPTSEEPASESSEPSAKASASGSSEPSAKEPVPEPSEPAETEEQKAEKALRRKKLARRAAIAAGCLVAASAAVYVGISFRYQNAFLPSTEINDMDVSGKSVEQVQQMVADSIAGYTLTLEGREGMTEQIRGQDIGLQPVFDGSLEAILDQQQPLRWGPHYFEGSQHTVEVKVSYDENLLDTVVDGLACMDESQTELPADAYVSDYQDGQGYLIMPEQGGTRLVKEKVLEGAGEAILGLQDTVSLEEAGAYARAKVTEEDPALKAKADRWNHYTDVKVTYQFGDQTEVLDGDVIHTWLSDDGSGSPVIDEEKVKTYVQQLAEKWDTVSKPKELLTSYGSPVTITGGNYGWKIDQEKEAEELLGIVQSGQSQEREPVFSQTAAAWGENDFGNTYVEVNLTTQHLFYYKDGSLVIESDLVSGNPSRGNATPGGAYFLVYKERNRILRGSRRADGSYEYASPVSYWMPFNGGIGLHDATWRGSFGGKIYRTNGSHGCVNLPFSVARTIYENIDTGTAVLCYNLDPTAPPQVQVAKTDTKATEKKTSSTSSAAKKQPAASTAAQPAAAPAAAAAVPAQDPAAAQTPAVQPEAGVPAPEGETQAQPAGPGEVTTAAQTEAAPEAGPGAEQNTPAETTAAPAETASAQTAPAEAAQPSAPGPVAGGPGGASAGDGTVLVDGPGM